MKKVTSLLGVLVILLYFGTLITGLTQRLSALRKKNSNTTCTKIFKATSGEFSNITFSDENFNVNCKRLRFTIVTKENISVTCDEFSVVDNGKYTFTLKTKPKKNKKPSVRDVASPDGRKKRDLLSQNDGGVMVPEGLDQDGLDKAERSKRSPSFQRQKGGNKTCDLPTCFEWNTKKDEGTDPDLEDVELTLDKTSEEKSVTFEIKVKGRKKVKSKKREKTYLDHVEYSCEWELKQ